MTHKYLHKAIQMSFIYIFVCTIFGWLFGDPPRIILLYTTIFVGSEWIIFLVRITAYKIRK